MTGEHKTYSLRGIILSNIAVSMTVLLLIFGFMMSAEYRTLGSMNSTVEKSTVLSQYYHTAESLTSSLEDWFYSNRGDKKEHSVLLLDQLRDITEKLKNTLVHPRFEDQYYLTQNFIKSVSLLLDKNLDEISQKERNAYSDCARIYSYMTDNESELNAILAQIISETYHEQFQIWKKQFLFILLIIGICCLYLYKVSSGIVQRILAPITTLAEQTRQFAAGIVHHRDNPRTSVRVMETGMLTDAFMEMEKTIQEQMQQLKNKLEIEREMHSLQLQNMQMQVALMETKIELIQSMISPHFMFNCLGMLSAMAYFEKAPKTRDASLKIADYLRKSLSLVGKKITIKEELQHTEKYMEIQKMRFGDRIFYKTDCGEECENFTVPAMILQPLVENAITHGLKEKEDNGKIEIHIFRDNDQIHILVEDDGSGMDANKLAQIREELAQPFKPGLHTIGLHSVASRLKAYYHDRVQLELSSDYGENTKILLCIKD